MIRYQGSLQSLNTARGHIKKPHQNYFQLSASVLDSYLISVFFGARILCLKCTQLHKP